MNATGGEVFNKTWWDAVDYIGVDGTYKGGDAGGAEEEEEEEEEEKRRANKSESDILEECAYTNS